MNLSRILAIVTLLSTTASVPTAEAQTYMRNLGTRALEFSTEMDRTSDAVPSYVTVGPRLRFGQLSASWRVDLYVNKFQEDGTLLFSHDLRIAGANGAGTVAYPTSIREAANGDLLITGLTNAVPNHPIFLARTDPNGFPLWVQLFGVPAGTTSGARGAGLEVLEDTDGSLVVVGSLIVEQGTAQYPVFLRTDAIGNPISLQTYFDLRFPSATGAVPSLGWGQFRDVEIAPAGPNSPPGYFVTGFMGTNSPVTPNAVPFRELIVARLDQTGNILWLNAYGPQFSQSIGTAIEVTATGGLQILGLYQNATQSLRLSISGAPLSHQLIYGFTSLGDIEEIAPETFVFVGRDANIRHEAMMVKMSGNAAGPHLALDFARGYGATYVEFFTDVRETSDQGFLPTGGTSTWCRGSADEYLVRTDAAGVVGCHEYDAQLGIEIVQYPVREIPTQPHDLAQTIANLIVAAPNTHVRFICPTPVIVPDPTPWDWFVRLDANGDSQVDVSDAVHILDHLFNGGQASQPPEAADGNGDGALDLSDAVFGLTYLFSDGTPPPAPFPNAGPDPAQEIEHVAVPEMLTELLTGIGEVPVGVLGDLSFPAAP